MSPKPYLKYRTFLTPLPTPRIATSSCSAAREFYCGIFLCVLWIPGAGTGSHTWCGRTFTIKSLSFFPPQMLAGTFQGDSLWPLGAFCWNVHSVWPCPSVNGIVKADSCLTSPCKQPSPFPFLRCSEQNWEELLPRQSGVAVRAADESNWKKHWEKKTSAWGHLSLHSPDCENSGHLFPSLEGAGLKCLCADRKSHIFFPRKASVEQQAGDDILLCDFFLGAVWFLSEGKKGWLGENWNWLLFRWIILIPSSTKST